MADATVPRSRDQENFLCIYQENRATATKSSSTSNAEAVLSYHSEWPSYRASTDVTAPG
jgi:hypothetical protein